MVINIDKVEDVDARIAAACVCFLPWPFVLAALAVFNEPVGAQYAAADPLIRLMPAGYATWLTAVAALLVSVFWIARFPPGKARLVDAAAWSLAGIVAASSVLYVLQAINGPQLPAFIPPEESAASGLVYGLSAGILEETVFRLLLLPLLLALLRPITPAWITLLVASLLTALAFAASHELGGTGMQGDLFLTRFLIPGLAMTVVFAVVSPAFVLSAHAMAHILIPALFVAAG